MVLRPTLKLAAKLKLAPLDDLPPPTHLSLFDWCVRSFMAARKSYLIFTHTQSLASVVVPQRGDSIAVTNRGINETPLSLLGMDSPKQCLRNLLNGDLGQSQIPVRFDNMP